MNLADIQMATLSQNASQAAELLKVLANEQRLLLLCRLKHGECAVNELVELSGLSQSSVSQHLARIRGSGVVATRRDGTTIFYRLANEDIKAIIDMLCDRFGPKEDVSKAA